MDEVFSPCWQYVWGELWVGGEFGFQSHGEGIGEFDPGCLALLGMGNKSEEDNHVEGGDKWCSLFVNKGGKLCKGIERELCCGPQFLGFFPRDDSGVKRVEPFEHVCESVKLVGAESGGVGGKGVLNLNRHCEVCVIL